MRTSLKAVGVTLASVAAVVSFAVPANAGSLSNLYGYVNATSPHTSAARQVVGPRTGIYLNAGTYRMTVDLLDPSSSQAISGTHGVRDLYIAAGTYSWRCFMTPVNSLSYTVGCDIINSAGGVATMGSGSFSVADGTYGLLGGFGQIS